MRTPISSPNVVRLGWRAALVAGLLFVMALPVTFAQAGGPEFCAITPDLLDGEGFIVDGQGFSTSGQGFSTSGQGFSTSGQGYQVAGLGFSTSGQGFSTSGQGFSTSGQGFSTSGQSGDSDLEAIENAVNPSLQWLTDYVANIEAAAAFNPNTPVAVVIVDNTLHGDQVQHVFNLANQAVSPANVRVFRLDLGALEFDISRINEQVQALVNDIVTGNNTTGLNPDLFTAQDVLLNLSFGILPCADQVVEVEGEIIEVNIAEAIDEVEEKATEGTVNGILECVIDNHDGTLTAHFGFENTTGQPVFIPFGEENRLIGGGLSADALRAATPQYFGTPELLANRPGRSGFFPNSAFQVTFDAETNLVWKLFDGTETASANSQRCGGEEFSLTRNPTHDETRPVNGILECVTQLDDNLYVAHFGYENKDGEPLLVDDASVNRLSGGGLSNEALNAARPTYFGTPDIPDVRTGRSDFFPNSAFQVVFNGDNLVWNLYGRTSTASRNSTRCIAEGYDIGDALAESGIPEEQVAPVLRELFTVAIEVGETDDNSLRDFQNTLQTYLDNAANGGPRIHAIASSGNYGPLFRAAIGNGQPLAPARWKQTTAVGATLGNNLESLWFYSQDGNVAVTGGTFIRETANIDQYLVGSSFSTPIVTRIYAAYAMVPGACQYVPDAAGDIQPPVNNPQDFNNSFITGPNPFNCDLEPVVAEAPTCNGTPATIYVDENGFVVGGPRNGQPYNGTLVGTDGVDVMVGTDGDDRLRGRGDNDIICGGLGADNIQGGDGNDQLFGGLTDLGADPSGNDLIVGGEGDDQLWGGDGDDTLRGGNGGDRLYGGGGNDRMLGQDGDDHLSGSAGDDNLNGGSGNDRMWGEAGNDVMNGGDGNDFMNGWQGADIINGGEGDDEIYGGLKATPDLEDTATQAMGNGENVRVVNDILKGNGGNDTIFGGLGDDYINGGDGDDLLYGGSEANPSAGNAPSGNDFILGGPGNDVMVGSDGADDMQGQDGDDRMSGGSGDDRMLGGLGDDIINGQNGMDILNGGDGNDTLWGEAGNDMMSGGDGDDNLYGQGDDDVMNGGEGNDTIYGGFPNQPEANTGNDTANGGPGNDTLIGGDGDDTLNGNQDDDTLTCGAGDNDTANGGQGENDVVTDAANCASTPNVP